MTTAERTLLGFLEEEERKKRMKDVSGGSPAPLGRAVEGGELDEHGEDEGRCGAH